MNLPAKKSVTIAALSLLLGGATAADHHMAARSLDQLIREKYAYLDKLPDGTIPESKLLDSEREAVSDRKTLLRYAEDRLASLADHHAITGSAFADSWAIVPSYADLWVIEKSGIYTIDAVRANSPAEHARSST